MLEDANLQTPCMLENGAAGRPLVSIIIPTLNSDQHILTCLKSVRNQSYRPIEVIVVDGGSSDRTIELAKKYADRVLVVDTKRVPEGHFTATYQRNYGARICRGEFLYYVDVDMILPSSLISECIEKIKRGYDAVIIPEQSFGKGFWAKCKILERRCYWNDDLVEAPRFFRKSVWDQLGGLDEELGAGGDDWDLGDRLLQNGYKIARVKNVVLHNEGKLTLSKLVRKRFTYGKDVIKYVKKWKGRALARYLPVRLAFIRNLKLFAMHPTYAIGILLMRTVEYLASFCGLIASILEGRAE